MRQRHFAWWWIRKNTLPTFLILPALLLGKKKTQQRQRNFCMRADQNNFNPFIVKEENKDNFWSIGCNQQTFYKVSVVHDYGLNLPLPRMQKGAFKQSASFIAPVKLRLYMTVSLTHFLFLHLQVQLWHDNILIPCDLRTMWEFLLCKKENFAYKFHKNRAIFKQWGLMLSSRNEHQNHTILFVLRKPFISDQKRAVIGRQVCWPIREKIFLFLLLSAWLTNLGSQAAHNL